MFYWFSRYLIASGLISLVFIVHAVNPGLAAQPYILVDAASGGILSQNKANHQWHPASLTKLMTAYVTFKAIENKEIEAGSPVIISRAATRQPPSRMGYKRGTSLRIDTALKIIIIKSANDVSHALGEAVAGTLDNFVTRMNAQAFRLGMTNTRFTNSNGLHHVNQVTSARDMALLSIRIIKDFPQYAYMFSASAIRTPTKTHHSYNLLLARFPGATGMKTGFVCASGFNLIASATRNGKTLIAVVLGTSSQTERAIEAAGLLGTGFSRAAKVQGSVYDPPPAIKTKPVNMRPIICTEAARAARYDPGAGKAKIKSEFLTVPKDNGPILEIRTGGISADPSDAYLTAAFKFPSRIPVPTENPGFAVSSIPAEPEEPPTRAVSIPLPTKRPR